MSRPPCAEVDVSVASLMVHLRPPPQLLASAGASLLIASWFCHHIIFNRKGSDRHPSHHSPKRGAFAVRAGRHAATSTHKLRSSADDLKKRDLSEAGDEFTVQQESILLDVHDTFLKMEEEAEVKIRLDAELLKVREQVEQEKEALQLLQQEIEDVHQEIEEGREGHDEAISGQRGKIHRLLQLLSSRGSLNDLLPPSPRPHSSPMLSPILGSSPVPLPRLGSSSAEPCTGYFSEHRSSSIAKDLPETILETDEEAYPDEAACSEDSGGGSEAMGSGIEKEQAQVALQRRSMRWSEAPMDRIAEVDNEQEHGDENYCGQQEHVGGIVAKQHEDEVELMVEQEEDGVVGQEEQAVGIARVGTEDGMDVVVQEEREDSGSLADGSEDGLEEAAAEQEEDSIEVAGGHEATVEEVVTEQDEKRPADKQEGLAKQPQVSDTGPVHEIYVKVAESQEAEYLKQGNDGHEYSCLLPCCDSASCTAMQDSLPSDVVPTNVLIKSLKGRPEWLDVKAIAVIDAQCASRHILRGLNEESVTFQADYDADHLAIGFKRATPDPVPDPDPQTACSFSSTTQSDWSNSASDNTPRSDNTEEAFQPCNSRCLPPSLPEPSVHHDKAYFVVEHSLTAFDHVSRSLYQSKHCDISEACCGVNSPIDFMSSRHPAEATNPLEFAESIDLSQPAELIESKNLAQLDELSEVTGLTETANIVQLTESNIAMLEVFLPSCQALAPTGNQSPSLPIGPFTPPATVAPRAESDQSNSDVRSSLSSLKADLGLSFRKVNDGICFFNANSVLSFFKSGSVVFEVVGPEVLGSMRASCGVAEMSKVRERARHHLRMMEWRNTRQSRELTLAEEMEIELRSDREQAEEKLDLLLQELAEEQTLYQKIEDQAVHEVARLRERAVRASNTTSGTAGKHGNETPPFNRNERH